MNSKRVLLIGVNAKYIHSNPAIYSLKAYTERKYRKEETIKGLSLPDGSLDLVEYTINQNKETILADIYRRKPDIAAFSCYIWNWNLIQDLLPELVKVLPKVELWLGGPEVSYHGETVLASYPSLTGIIVGEGEETFYELFQYWQEGKGTLSQIKGILLPDGYTGMRPPVLMDEVPFFYEDYGLEPFQNHILYYESQRGCPFGCAYCLSSVDRRVRLRDTELVKQHMQFFLDYKVPQVKFVDRTFNCNPGNALEIWDYIKKHDNGVTNFHFEIAADLLTKEQLTVMSDMRPGLIQLEIGVQSTNEQTLHAINRYMSQTHLIETVDIIRGFGNVHQHLDLIAGLPFEDYKSFGKSFDDVYAMKPQQLQLGFLKVLKGSPIEEKTGEYGIIYNAKPPYEVLYSKWLTYDDVLRLKGVEEMVELYYNSNQFMHTLPVLVEEFSSPFSMYETLAEYYEKKCYFTNVPARVYRYQVLLEFAVSVNPKKEQLFAELLTFDMYLRENVKSRPSFASDWEHTSVDAKRKLREFYRREAKTPRYLTGYEGYEAAQLMKMTHIERFCFPVWEADSNGEMEELSKEVYVLFDYARRNPLTHDATWVTVQL